MNKTERAIIALAFEETGDVEKQAEFGPIKYDQIKGLGNVPINQQVKYKGFVVFMKPSQFLKLAKTRDFTEESNLQGLTKLIKSGRAIGSPYLEIEYNKNKPPRVYSHDGRTRMETIRRLYGDIEVMVHIFTGYKRAKDLNMDMIKLFYDKARSQNGKLVTNNFEPTKVYWLNGWKNLNE